MSDLVDKIELLTDATSKHLEFLEMLDGELILLSQEAIKQNARLDALESGLAELTWLVAKGKL